MKRRAFLQMLGCTAISAPVGAMNWTPSVDPSVGVANFAEASLEDILVELAGRNLALRPSKLVVPNWLHDVGLVVEN